MPDLNHRLAVVACPIAMVQQTKGVGGCLANPWPKATHP